MKDRTNLIIGLIVIVLIGFLIWPALRGKKSADDLAGDNAPNLLSESTSTDSAATDLGLLDDGTTATPNQIMVKDTPTASITSGNLMPILVYFNNRQTDPEMRNCDRVYPVTRQVTKTNAVARASLLELFGGPKTAEVTKGFVTSLNPGVEIKSLRIVEGTALVDLNSAVTDRVTGTCRLMSIRAQIESTLKQFPTIQNVTLSVDGQIINK